ncbi:MAG: hypothetical protein ACR2QO_17360 [Acidimicrobiales bacterium]
MAGAFDGWVPLTAEVIISSEPELLLAAAVSVVDPEIRADALSALARTWSSAADVDVDLDCIEPLGDGFRILLTTRDTDLSHDGPAVDALARAVVWGRLRSSGVVSVRSWAATLIEHAAATSQPATATGVIRRGDYDRYEVSCRTADGQTWVASIDPTGARPPEAVRT